jgi:hypothetical protein
VGIFPYIGLKHRPKIYGRYLHFFSVPESWPLIISPYFDARNLHSKHGEVRASQLSGVQELLSAAGGPIDCRPKGLKSTKCLDSLRVTESYNQESQNGDLSNIRKDGGRMNIMDHNLDYNDLTSWRHWNGDECVGESSRNGLTSAMFRLVNHCNSARWSGCWRFAG